MSEPQAVTHLTEVPRNSAKLASEEKARRARRVSQALSVAYHQARGLSELTAMIVRDVDALPIEEREPVRRANIAALEAFSRLNSIIVDVGNVASSYEPPIGDR